MSWEGPNLIGQSQVSADALPGRSRACMTGNVKRAQRYGGGRIVINQVPLPDTILAPGTPVDYVVSGNRTHRRQMLPVLSQFH